MNYAELVTAIEDTTENTFTVTQLNTFIKHAENTIFQAIKFPAMRLIATTTIAAGTGYVYLNETETTTYLYTDTLMVKANGSTALTPLIQKDYSFIYEAYPDTASITGRPKHYAIHKTGTNADGDGDDFSRVMIQIGPESDGIYDLVHAYYTYPESITNGMTLKTGTNTSYLGDNFDNVLLDGALVQAARFMKAEGDIVAMYDQQFGASLKLAQELSANIYKDGYTPEQSPIQAPVA